MRNFAALCLSLLFASPAFAANPSSLERTAANPSSPERTSANSSSPETTAANFSSSEGAGAVGNTPCERNEPTVMPIQVTASDMVTKVYGVLGCNMSQAQADDALRSCLHLSPEADEGGLWLDSDGGYGLCYGSMTPDVSAVASYNGNRVSDYTYFFLFPCEEGVETCGDPSHCTCGHCHLTPEAANAGQAAFCGTLLQEMHDLGMDMGALTLTDAIFETIGHYRDNEVNVRLVRDPEGFIVILDVTPAPIPADDSLAMADMPR